MSASPTHAPPPELTTTQAAALRGGAVYFDRSDRRRMRLTGLKAAEMITGLVTNDVLALVPGHGQYAAALSAKGKIVADLRIFRLVDGLLIDSSGRAGDAWQSMVQKYVNPRLAPHRDVSAELADFGVFGTGAIRAVASALGVPPDGLEALGPYEHLSVPWRDGTVIVARVPELSVPGVELFIDHALSGDMIEVLLGVGAVEGLAETWEVSRVEAARPAFGIDMDDSNLAQEANLDELGAISYTKGCYLGQETVARVHFRGHVNRHLRRLKFACTSLPPAGAELMDDQGKPVGTVTSVVRSPRLGGVGIGMVRREVPDGMTVRVKWDQGECGARVSTAAPSTD